MAINSFLPLGLQAIGRKTTQMTKSTKIQVIILSLALVICSVSSSTTPNISSCPMDLTYVERIPWNTSVCPTSLQKPTAPTQSCCQALLGLFGIGLAQHLKQTSLLQLPDIPSASACTQDFQSKLNSLSLPSDVVSTCFESPEFFVTSSQKCAGIQTKQDWVDKLGPKTQLDTSCQSDLSDPAACEVCVKAGLKVQARLTALDGNATHSTECFYFLVLYTAGVISDYSPDSTSSTVCLFALPMSSTTTSKSKANRGLSFSFVGVAVVVTVLIFSGLLEI